MRSVFACAAILLLVVAPPACAQDEASADALRRWVTAVREHAAGKPDAAAGVVASMSYGERRVLNGAMEVFLRDLRTQPQRSRTKAMADIQALIASVQKDPGVAAFLQRAVILHTDAAIYAEDFPSPPDDAPEPIAPPMTASQTWRSPPPAPPLLSNERLVQHLDGRVIGETLAVWHWPFARSLLRVLVARSGVGLDVDRAFVSDWYHAVAAYLFATSHHGDLNLHLQAAERVLPDDPRILFDRGCNAELLGLPIYQALSDDPENRGSLTRLAIVVPAAGATDAEAEQLFRRALAGNPAYAEARVHLARLLDRRGRHDEAAQEIDAALDAKLDRDVTFYARLFAGRVALARNRASDAVAHFVEALKLFPDAQSALLGASQAAVMAADIAEAVAFAQRLSPRSEDVDADPWWVYRFGPGRDTNALMAAVWTRTAR